VLLAKGGDALAKEGPVALILDGSLINTLYQYSESIEDLVINQANMIRLKSVMKGLDIGEQELITYVYFKRYSLKNIQNLRGLHILLL
jgi:hypothetical protein